MVLTTLSSSVIIFRNHPAEPFDSRDVSKIRNEDRAVLAYLKNSRFNLEKSFNMMVMFLSHFQAYLFVVNLKMYLHDISSNIPLIWL